MELFSAVLAVVDTLPMPDEDQDAEVGRKSQEIDGTPQE